MMTCVCCFVLVGIKGKSAERGERKSEMDLFPFSVGVKTAKTVFEKVVVTSTTTTKQCDRKKVLMRDFGKRIFEDFCLIFHFFFTKVSQMF